MNTSFSEILQRNPPSFELSNFASSFLWINFRVPEGLFISNTKQNIIKYFVSQHKLKMPPIKLISSGFKLHVVGEWKYQVQAAVVIAH